jgi:DNA-binding MarR family transcriptional regulator
MYAPFEDMTSLDRIVHEPARLAILTALNACESCDFLYLQRLTGLTKGNLSNHLAKLQQSGLVETRRLALRSAPHTSVSLTPEGRESLARYWSRLDTLRRAAARWRFASSDAAD